MGQIKKKKAQQSRTSFYKPKYLNKYECTVDQNRQGDASYLQTVVLNF